MQRWQVRREHGLALRPYLSGQCRERWEQRISSRARERRSLWIVTIYKGRDGKPGRAENHID